MKMSSAVTTTTITRTSQICIFYNEKQYFCTCDVHFCTFHDRSRSFHDAKWPDLQLASWVDDESAGSNLIPEYAKLHFQMTFSQSSKSSLLKLSRVTQPRIWLRWYLRKKKKLTMNFFETFPECSPRSIVSKKTIKVIGHHSRLRDMMGQSLCLYSC